MFLINTGLEGIELRIRRLLVLLLHAAFVMIRTPKSIIYFNDLDDIRVNAVTEVHLIADEMLSVSSPLM